MSPKSNKQRCREYRARLKLLKSHQPKPDTPPKDPIKDNKQRCREYRAKVKVLKSTSGDTELSTQSLQPNDPLENVSEPLDTQDGSAETSSVSTAKDNKQRCREYRARLKALRSSNEGIELLQQPLQLNHKVENFSGSSAAQNGSEMIVAETTSMSDDLNEPYLKTKWKGLRDTFRCEMKKDLMYRRTKCVRSKPTWRHYKDLLFLKEQMLPTPPIWDSREKPVDPLILSINQSTSQIQHQKTSGKKTAGMKIVRATVPSSPGIADNNMEDVNFIDVKEEPEYIQDLVEHSDEENRSFDENFTSCGDDSTLLSESLALDETCSSNENTNREPLVDPIELSGQFDDNYHFLMSLLPHIQKISGERQMSLRMQIQEMVYKEVYKK